MSIIAECEYGWLLCHKHFIEQMLQKALFEVEHPRLSFKYQDIFDIKVPFVMNSEAEKIGTKMENLGDKSSAVSCKRKRKTPCIQSNSIASELLDEDLLNEALTIFVKLGKDCQYFKFEQPTAQDWKDNNNAAKKAAAVILNGNTVLEQLCHNTAMWKYGHQKSRIEEVQHKLFFIPEMSSYFVGNISDENFDVFAEKFGQRFDLILMDPPWQNKSVKRMKHYNWMNELDFISLPINKLANTNCLVLVWVTNNSRQIKIVKETFFPEWGVTYEATWHWVKVSNIGTPVYSLSSQHKKPFEHIIIGRIRDVNPPVKAMDNNKFLISTPSSVHSHKPPLSEIMKHYLKDDAISLELFARYLLPNWVSCGNDVLRFQELAFYNELYL